MTTYDHDSQGRRASLGPDAAALAELARLSDHFRGHHIFWDTARARGIRYVAHAMQAGARPHTIITRDLTELRHELQRASDRPRAPGVGGVSYRLCK
jgi:hypothetical protein